MTSASPSSPVGPQPALGAEHEGPRSTDVRQAIGATRGSRYVRWIWRAVGLCVVVGIGVGIWLWRRGAAAEPKQQYVTAAVTRGSLQASITATGNLQGRDTVEVGAEVSGTVKALYVDFNDTVKKGQLLAELDPDQAKASRDQSSAQLVAARAELASRKATAEEAKLTAARTEQLAKDGLVSQQQLEAAQAAAVRAEAAVQSAQAQITVAGATLSSNQTKLEKTKIIAPMDGVVLSRNVEVGQTVAASLQAPVLFTLARDLREMELTVAIDEADIGQVKAGQPATFTVDAYPGREFPAELKIIHNISTLKDNVVTYEARLSVRNDDLALRPGMTATATIVTAARENVLLVPNAALRFKPPTQDSGPGIRLPGVRMGGPPGGTGSGRARGTGRPEGAGPPTGSGGPAGSAGAGAPGRERVGEGGRVWILVNGEPQEKRVRLGLTDGTKTELLRGDLEEGSLVITDLAEAAK